MKKIIIGAVMIVGLIAGFVYWQKGSTLSAEESQPASSAQAPRAQAVSFKEVQKETIELMVELPGRITAFRQSQVRPQVDGIVMERLFDEGGNVEKGQQLYQIDDARYKAALNSAYADFKSAQANIKSLESRRNRYKQLVEINAVSKQEYDDVMAEYDQANAAVGVAQAAVDVAKVNLGYTKVYAPIAGRISRSFVTEGALVTANQSQQLATITQLNPIYVDMQQSGTEALSLRSRMAGVESIPVDIIMDESKNELYPHQGTLQFSEVTVDETTGSIALRAQVPNEDMVLLPGLFVRGRLHLGQSDVIMVPQRATTRTPQGDIKLWVVGADNVAHQKTITVEQAYQDSWIVADGLSAGDKVIVEGYQKVAEGAPVSPSPWQNPITKQENKE